MGEAKITSVTIYEQLCEDFRSLNGFLWQTPLIVMTLNGGLWFSVATFDLTDRGRSSLLIFGFVADLLMVWALIRLRFVMTKLQSKIREMDGRLKTGPNYQIVFIFSSLLLIAALGSSIAAWEPASYFHKSVVAGKAISVAAHIDDTKSAALEKRADQ